jgi:hypothetical protein
VQLVSAAFSNTPNDHFCPAVRSCTLRYCVIGAYSRLFSVKEAIAVRRQTDKLLNEMQKISQQILLKYPQPGSDQPVQNRPYFRAIRLQPRVIAVPGRRGEELNRTTFDAPELFVNRTPPWTSPAYPANMRG